MGLAGWCHHYFQLNKFNIDKIEKKNVIDHLYKIGGRLKKGMNDLAKIYDLEDMIACAGYPCRSVMTIKKVGKYKKPLITKSLIELAEKEKADAISHGATGKGNDQIRFEIGAYALNPSIKVIAPWREWEYKSRL